MKIKSYIARVVEKGKQEDMQKLSDMLDELICDLKENNHDLYEYYKMCLYELAYGEVLSEEMAEHWVSSMSPRALWSREETDSVKAQYGINIKSEDFYVLMNMAYSDYGNILGDPNEHLDRYVQFTKDFIEDKDAKDNKIYNYYKNIVKKD